MQRTRSLTIMLATLASMFILVAAPVAADSGSSSGGDSGGSSSGSGSGSDSGGSGSSDSSGSGSSSSDTGSGGSSSSSNDTTEQSGGTDSSGSSSDSHGVSDLLDQFRGDAKDELMQMRKYEHSSSNEQERQHACDNIQANVDNHISDFSASAQNHLGVFTDIFTKVQAFYASKGLTTSNYDALVAAATAKQTAAQTAVDALKGLSVNIDCTQVDPAQALQTIKDAVGAARMALQDYRSAIKDLIVAISNALDTQDSSQGGTQ